MEEIKNEIDLRVKFKQDTGGYHSFEMYTLGSKGYSIDKSFKREYVIWLEEQLIKNK